MNTVKIIETCKDDKFKEIEEIKCHEELKKNLEANEIIIPNAINLGSPIIQNSIEGFVLDSANIFCKFHKKEFVIVNSYNFKIQCLKCLEKGEKYSNLGISTKYGDNESIQIQCDEHQDSNADFYCDDCNIYICKKCFANTHRTHKSFLLSEMAKNYLDKLKFQLEKISLISPKLEEDLKFITEIDNKIKLIRDGSLKKMNSLIPKIESLMKSTNNNYKQEFESNFVGIDIELDDVYHRLKCFSKRSTKLISELNEMQIHLDSTTIKKNSVNICQYMKSKYEVIKEIKKLLLDSNNFINYKIETIKSKIKDKLNLFNKLTSKTFKQLRIFEKSVINSVHTGITSASLRLRRFSKFSKKVYEYYKTSSLVCKVSTPICLAGLGLCGAYIPCDSYGEFKNQRYTPIPIQIMLSEEKENMSHPILNEFHSLLPIRNSNDPIFFLYLNKAINLKSNTKYTFTVTNNHKDSFLELWCGEVAKVFLQEMRQSLNCNTTGVKFEFCSSQGVESDFNEFNMGIISDLIFSPTEK